MSLRGGVHQWHNKFINFSFVNPNNILRQYFIMEPNWENHKLFSINCKNCFTCYIDGRCTSSLISTDWSGCTHTLVYQHQLVGGYDPLFSQLQLTGKHQLPLHAPTCPCSTQPPLIHRYLSFLPGIFFNYWSSNLDCRDTFFSHSFMYIYSSK